MKISDVIEASVKIGASLVAQRVKHLPAMWKTQFPSPGQEVPLEKEMATTPVLWPGESHGGRSLVESDTTEMVADVILF